MKGLNFQTDTDILKQLYGDKAGEMNRDDKFLMDFILNERWKGGKEETDNYAEYQQK